MKMWLSRRSNLQHLSGTASGPKQRPLTSTSTLHGVSGLVRTIGHVLPQEARFPRTLECRTCAGHWDLPSLSEIHSGPEAIQPHNMVVSRRGEPSSYRSPLWWMVGAMLEIRACKLCGGGEAA